MSCWASEPPKQKLWSKKEGRTGKRKQLGLQSESTCSLRIVELCFALPAAGPVTGRGRGTRDLGVQGKIMGQGASTQTLNPNHTYITGESQLNFGQSVDSETHNLYGFFWVFLSRARPVLLFTQEVFGWYCLCILYTDANCTSLSYRWCTLVTHEGRSKRQAGAGWVNVRWWNLAIVQSDILMFLSSTLTSWYKNMLRCSSLFNHVWPCVRCRSCVQQC